MTLAVILNADHTYAYAKGKKESFENYKAGAFRPNLAAFEEIARWLAMHAGR